MAYERNNLVSRAGYSGVGDFWDTITDAAGSVLKIYGTEQQAQGAAAASQQANRDLQAALLARQGISTSTLLIGGAAVGIVALILLRKKKD
jgi:hypothetical protein